MMLPMHLLQVPQIQQGMDIETGTSRDGPPSEASVSRQRDTSPATVTGRSSRDHVVGDVYSQIGTSTFSTIRLTSVQGIPSSTLRSRGHSTSIFVCLPWCATPPVTSTPVPLRHYPIPSSSPSLNTIPYPERPHSPSPAPVPIGLSSHDRRKVRLIGLSDSRGSRNLTVPQPLMDLRIDPASLLRTPPQSSHELLGLDSTRLMVAESIHNDIGAGLGIDFPACESRRHPAAIVAAHDVWH